VTQKRGRRLRAGEFAGIFGGEQRVSLEERRIYGFVAAPQLTWKYERAEKGNIFQAAKLGGAGRYTLALDLERMQRRRLLWRKNR